MTHIGRNDPCHCGSGRKFKHCCLRADSVVDPSARRGSDPQELWRRIREAEGRLMPRMWEVALKAWGQGGVDEAYSVFFSDTPVPDDILTHREHESLFLTWLALRFAPAAGGRARGRSVPRPAALMLLEQADDLTDLERRFVTEAARRPVSFHIVTGVDPGRSIDLEDILTGATCRVTERTASTTIRPGGVVYARTVTVDGESIMVGCGAALLKPTRRSDLVDIRRQLAGRRAHLTEREVFDLDDDLRRWYLQAADHEFNPPLPTLTNTDGDPLAPTTLHFALRCTPAEAYAALRPLQADDADDALLLDDDAEHDADGRLSGFSFDWTKAGNRMHKDWANTILGKIDVRGDALTASVNSNRRAARLRREIEKRLGKRVAFVRAVIESIDMMMKQARESRRLSPEVHQKPEPAIEPEILAELMERHWENWLDERIPALKNKTPRQAAKTAAGRERLEALLAEFEWRGGAPVERLRAVLKL